MRSIPWMTGSPSGEYFRSIRNVGWILSFSTSTKFRMKHSLLRILAISTLSFEAGISTRSWCDWMPLRMRVNISAIGSVIVIRELLPACLRDTRDVSAEREMPEANPAKLKLAQIAARPTALFAAILLAGHELRLPLRFDDHCRSCHVSPLPLPERHSQFPKEEASLLVVFRGRDDGDVHALRFVDFRDVDLREDEVIADADGVVATAVE